MTGLTAHPLSLETSSLPLSHPPEKQSKHMTKFIFILNTKEQGPYQKRAKEMSQVLSRKSMHRSALQDSSTQELEPLKEVGMTH
jgi:hypothetical protein